jgi:hypothetical protein
MSPNLDWNSLVSWNYEPLKAVIDELMKQNNTLFKQVDVLQERLNKVEKNSGDGFPAKGTSTQFQGEALDSGYHDRLQILEARVCELEVSSAANGGNDSIPDSTVGSSCSKRDVELIVADGLKKTLDDMDQTLAGIRTEMQGLADSAVAREERLEAKWSSSTSSDSALEDCVASQKALGIELHRLQNELASTQRLWQSKATKDNKECDLKLHQLSTELNQVRMDIDTAKGSNAFSVGHHKSKDKFVELAPFSEWQAAVEEKLRVLPGDVRRDVMNTCCTNGDMQQAVMESQNTLQSEMDVLSQALDTLQASVLISLEECATQANLTEMKTDTFKRIEQRIHAAVQQLQASSPASEPGEEAILGRKKCLSCNSSVRGLEYQRPNTANFVASGQYPPLVFNPTATAVVRDETSPVRERWDQSEATLGWCLQSSMETSHETGLKGQDGKIYRGRSYLPQAPWKARPESVKSIRKPRVGGPPPSTPRPSSTPVKQKADTFDNAPPNAVGA